MKPNKVLKTIANVRKLVGCTLIAIYESRVSLAMDYVAEQSLDETNPAGQFMDLEMFQLFCAKVDESIDRFPGMRYAVHNTDVVTRVMDRVTLSQLEELFDVDLCHNVSIEIAAKSMAQIERFFYNIILDNKLDFPQHEQAIEMLVRYITNKPVL